MKMGRSLASSYYDFSEKLNFYWTSLILLLFVFLVAVLKYVFLGSLISCLTPVHFPNPMGNYAHTVCWENDKFYIPLDDESLVPEQNLRNDMSTATFHTWIPVVLIFMMLGFQIPRGVKLVCDLCLGNPTNTISDNQTENAEQLAQIIRESRYQSSFIRTLSFIIVKILVVVNILIQLIFVKLYFRNSVRYEAIESYDSDLDEIVNKTTPVSVYIFPKSILCDFSIKQFESVQSYTIQCNMPINYLYEQFIHIFWFGLLGVGIFTGLVLVVQLASLTIPPFVRLRFRGIIPEKELNQRNFSIDDSLLMLLDIENRSGLSMARTVATLLFQSSGDDALTSIPMTTNGANAQTHTSPPPGVDESKYNRLQDSCKM
ncbi:innexin unc-9 [Patella vulgata]|uniref:innexin unc-9 n=1 Tax=Patella vulgata TaxID=6465 RepID=UPI00217FB7A9|nr:innexin unc-9 [Patella vulgata]